MTTSAGFLPNNIIAGESIWIAAANAVQSGQDITFADYAPSGGYTLAYQFAASTPITVSASANGDSSGWTLEVTAAQTLVWKPAQVAYAGYITHTATDRVFAVDAGRIAVGASPVATSSWKTALANVDAAIASYSETSTQRSVMIDGMQVSFRSVSELISLRNWLQGMVNADTGNRPRRIIRSRFA